MEVSNEWYLAKRQDLLKNLADAGKNGRRSLLVLEKLYKPTQEALQNVNHQGFEINIEKLRSHLYVTSSTMKKLDQVYCKHYQSDRASALQQCFNMMGPLDDSKEDLQRFKNYLMDIEFPAHRAFCESRGDCALCSPRGLSVWCNACYNKASSPLWASFGRICLPLPSKTMLDDLRECLQVNAEIMNEVLRFQPTTSPFLMIF